MAGLAILCPGQGAQSAEMFDLALADARSKPVLDPFADAAGFDPRAIAQCGTGLFANAVAQPALVGLALAHWTMLAPALPAPLLFAGYSVGEVSAWACAGAWSAARAARLTLQRAQLMDRHAPHDCGMLAVRGLPFEQVLAQAPALQLAIVNEPDHAVFAAAVPALAAAETALQSRGAWTRRLDVHTPSHTPMLADAAQAFAQALQRIEPSGEPSAPVLRGIDGHRLRRAADAPSALSAALATPIRWDRCMLQIAESGATVALELGPGRALSQMLGQAHPRIAARSVSDFRSTAAISAWVRRQLQA